MNYNLLYPSLCSGPCVQVQSALPSAKRMSHLISLTSRAVPQNSHTALLHSVTEAHRGRCWFHPTHAWLSHSILNPVLPEATTTKQSNQPVPVTGRNSMGWIACGGRWYSPIRYGHQNNNLDQMDHFRDIIKKSVFSWGHRA